MPELNYLLTIAREVDPSEFARVNNQRTCGHMRWIFG